MYDYSVCLSRKAQGGGIGTLIIFISIVLVAAIAAYVLLGTAGTLQSKSLLVGKETTRRVSTQFICENLYGMVNDTSSGTEHGIEKLIAIVKLSPGSDPIDMELVNLHFAAEDLLISRILPNQTTAGNDTLAENNIADYYYIEIRGNNDSLLESGESFELHFLIEDKNGKHPIPERTEILFTIRPGDATETTVDAMSPVLDHDLYVKLYP